MAAHDNSIVSLLKVLRVELPSDSLPRFGSHLCIETYIDPETSDAFVKLDLNDEPLVIGGSDVSDSKAVETTASTAGSGGLTPFVELEALVSAFNAGS